MGASTLLVRTPGANTQATASKLGEEKGVKEYVPIDAEAEQRYTLAHNKPTIRPVESWAPATPPPLNARACGRRVERTLSPRQIIHAQ